MTLTATVAALALGLAPAGAAQITGSECRELELRRAKPMMATLVVVTVRGCADGGLEERVREAFAEGARLSAMLSEWDPASPVSLLDTRAGLEPVRVPTELFEVLEAALGVSELTGGAFDVTWAPLGEAWRFDGASPPRLPPTEQVERLRALVGHRHLILDPAARTAFLDRPGMRIGLGGIAKGYIAAAMADLLVRRGVRDVLVAASGDIAARGRNGRRPWTVAVRDPRVPSRLRALVELHDESISTSGDYERFFVLEGRRYSHILDPATGRPAQGTTSVTVVGSDGAMVDALATGLFVLGSERGAAPLHKLPDVSALFIDEDGSVHIVGNARRFGAVRESASAPAESTPGAAR